MTLTESNGVTNPTARVVFFWSATTLNWRLDGSNPYAGLLAQALAEHRVRVEVRRSGNLGFVWEFPRPFDIVHFNWNPTFYEHPNPVLAVLRLLAFAAMLLVARLRGFRIVWTMHNVVPHEQIRASHGEVARRLVTTLANAVICHCEYAKSVLGRRFGRRWGVHVIPHGSFAHAYPREATRAEARRSFDIPDDAFVYGFFGNIRAYKGVEQLIEEFGSLEGDNLRLLVAGALHPNYHGPLHTTEIQDRRVIANLRHIADEEVQLVMAAVDVLVLPFLDTLTSGSAILALGHGTPLVLPRRGCLPELVGDGAAAVLYDPDDPGALRQALLDAQALDPETSVRATGNVDAGLNWAGIARKTLAAYGLDGSSS